MTGSHEANGSIPFRSTNYFKHLTLIAITAVGILL